LPALADPQGLAFDRVAEDYDRGRPGWPTGVIDGIDGETVLDLAAGSGKLTALLLEHFPQVIAVEPLAGMRAVLERNVPGAESLPGSAERIPLDDRSVDAVFVAEAFHWFDSTLAAREVTRVLRPGGTLVVCFNEWLTGYVPHLPPAAKAALESCWSRLPPPGGPKVESGLWKLGLRDAPFTPLVESSCKHEFETDRDGVIAYYLSTSSTAQLEAAEREALRDELRLLLDDVTYRLSLAARTYRATRL
jgi:SAM-dependent methyltransferase